MDVLCQPVIDHQPAVVVQLCHRVALGLHQPFQQAAADKAEVAGQDQVEVLRLAAGVGKVLAEGLCGGGGHCRAHIVDVSDAQVRHRPHRHGAHKGRLSILADHARARAGDRPLGSGGALSAVLQREAELPLGRAEVGGGDRQALPRKPRVHKHAGKAETFRHGGAGAVQPEEGDCHLAGGIGRADALVEQVAGKQKVDLLLLHAALLQRQVDGLLLHQRLGLFPGLFAEGGVVGEIVEIVCQRALLLLFGPHRGKAQHAGRGGELQGFGSD